MVRNTDKILAEDNKDIQNVGCHVPWGNLINENNIDFTYRWTSKL